MKYLKIDASHVWDKKHLRQYVIGMIGFGLFIPLVVFIGKHTQAHLSVKIMIAASPVFPFIIAMRAFLNNLKTMDELWRKIQADALIVTAILTMVFIIAFGMLQIVNIIPLFSVFYLFPIMMITWSFSFAYFYLKYNGQ